MTRVRTHPGEVLREEFLAPLGMSSHQLADAIDVPANRISEIVREARGVTADTALRLAGHFKTTPEFWMNLQSAHDLSKARAEAANHSGPLYFTAKRPKLVKTASGQFIKPAQERAASALTQRGAVASKVSRKDNPSKKK